MHIIGIVHLYYYLDPHPRTVTALGFRSHWHRHTSLLDTIYKPPASKSQYLYIYMWITVNIIIMNGIDTAAHLHIYI